MRLDRGPRLKGEINWTPPEVERLGIGDESGRRHDKSGHTQTKKRLCGHIIKICICEVFVDTVKVGKNDRLNSLLFSLGKQRTNKMGRKDLLFVEITWRILDIQKEPLILLCLLDVQDMTVHCSLSPQRNFVYQPCHLFLFGQPRTPCTVWFSISSLNRIPHTRVVLYGRRRRH